MLAAESQHRRNVGLDQTFAGMSGSVAHDISDMTSSGNYYVTPDVCREMHQIRSGIDHIKLDHDFLRSSRDWGNKYDPGAEAANKQGAIAAMDRAARTMKTVKGSTEARRVAGLRDNQVRETNFAAVGQLKGVDKDMAPFAGQSTERIKQFCDHIGVTDRYTGFRNNLNRGSRDPKSLGYSWMDSAKQNPYNNTLNVGWRTGGRSQDSAPRLTQSAPVKDVKMPLTSKSIQERCGINMRFPGRTEYMHRYDKPPTDQPTPGYIVNPLPDFMLHERPLGQPKLFASATEYQTRYLFPDGSTLVRLPWLRK